MKILEYISVPGGGEVVAKNIFSNQELFSKDKFIYYTSFSGAASPYPQIVDNEYNPILDISLHKNNSEYFFNFYNASSINKDISLLNPFNCGDKISVTVEMDNYYGSLEIYNISTKQLLTTPASADNYLIGMVSNPSPITFYIPSEGLFYKFEMYKDTQLVCQLVPAIENNKAYLYDKITHNKYELLMSDENAYNALNFGPEEFAENITLDFIPSKTSTTPLTVRVFPVDQEGKICLNSPTLYL